eukprot:3683216-Rhodomonas_salina.1
MGRAAARGGRTMTWTSGRRTRRWSKYSPPSSTASRTGTARLVPITSWPSPPTGVHVRKEKKKERLTQAQQGPYFELRNMLLLITSGDRTPAPVP